MSHRPSTLVVGMLALALSHAARAAEAPPTAADVTRLENEIARLQKELREQRELVLQLMQMQEATLRFLHGGGSAPGSLPVMPGAPPASPAPAGPSAAAPGGRATAAGATAATASITGHVRVGDGVPNEAFVYLDGPRAIAAHPPTIEIKQANRQFVPTVAVIPVGGHVLFPNQDTIFHNVFSNTPGDAFDVGPLKSGQTPKPVTLLKPGHVEIFCNIHSKMRADVLVVPNAHWTRVRPDGSFHLPAIPVGSRRIVLWGPALKPVAQQVEVTADGATLTLTTEAGKAGPHMNKQGAAYGSYEN
jgi:plastocyanin